MVHKIHPIAVREEFVARKLSRESAYICKNRSRQVTPRSSSIHGSVIVYWWLEPMRARSRDECSYVTQCLFFIDESFILFLPRFYIMWLKSLRKHRVVLCYFYLHNIFIQWEKSIIQLLRSRRHVLACIFPTNNFLNPRAQRLDEFHRRVTCWPLYRDNFIADVRYSKH